MLLELMTFVKPLITNRTDELTLGLLLSGFLLVPQLMPVQGVRRHKSREKSQAKQCEYSLLHPSSVHL